MDEKKQLNEEELEKVTGGDFHEIKTVGDISKYSEYTIELDYNQPIQGQKYLFKGPDGGWFFGVLSNQYRQWRYGWIYDINVEDGFHPAGIFVSEWNTLEVPYSSGWRAYGK